MNTPLKIPARVSTISGERTFTISQLAKHEFFQYIAKHESRRKAILRLISSGSLQARRIGNIFVITESDFQNFLKNA